MFDFMFLRLFLCEVLDPHGNYFDTSTGTLWVVGNVCPHAYRKRYDIKTVVFHTSVNCVGERAFYECHIDTLHLPDTLVSIGDYAFGGCRDITALHLPDALKTIGTGAFFGCVGIVELHLPEALVSIGESVFEGCSSIVVLNLPDTLVSIGKSAFESCVGIVGLHLPEGLQTIGYCAFVGCSGIVDLRLPDTLVSIGDLAFSGCSGIPVLHLPEGLRTIGIRVFDRCTGIVDLRLPTALETIGKCAFSNCLGIQTLHVPDGVQQIDDGAFYRCVGIVSIYLPETLGIISEGAVYPRIYSDNYRTWGSFHGCTNVSIVLAPDNLVQGKTANLSKVFGCPVLSHIGLTSYSSVPLLRRTFWHPTTYQWCTSYQHNCVLTVLVSELRLDRQNDAIAVLPVLAHDLWLLVIQFVPRHTLGRP
jgi:hypothetical protein